MVFSVVGLLLMMRMLVGMFEVLVCIVVFVFV